MKSSAVSVSILPGLPTRESVAIRPSGFPVLKKNALAAAGTLSSTATDNTRQYLEYKMDLLKLSFHHSRSAQKGGGKALSVKLARLVKDVT